MTLYLLYNFMKQLRCYEGDNVIDYNLYNYKYYVAINALGDISAGLYIQRSPYNF